MAEKSKVVTSQMRKGVKPGIILPPCPEMGRLPYAEAVELNKKMNAQAEVSVKLAAGDESAAIGLMEELGYDVKKKSDSPNDENKPEKEVKKTEKKK